MSIINYGGSGYANGWYAKNEIIELNQEWNY